MSKRKIYIPTNEERELIVSKCNEVIDVLVPLDIDQKAFALVQLCLSFKDASGIDIAEAIMTTEKEGDWKVSK